MDTATQTHLPLLRNALEFRLAALSAELHAAELARERGTSDAGDLKDEAAQRLAREAAAAEEKRNGNELAQVHAALQRLDSGVYGDCLDCRRPIALERLRVQPAAERCAACQSAFEGARPA